jgi:Spy/CpxP family protein refolding chaperone
MKRMKWGWAAVAALGILMALGPQTNAADDQGQPPARGRRQTAEERFKKLATDLNLTQEQQDKLKPVLQAQAKKARELRQDTSLSAEDRRAKGRTLREDTAKQVKAILTPEQWEKYQKLQQERRPRRRQQQGN